MNNNKTLYFQLILYAIVLKGHFTLSTGWKVMSIANVTFDTSAQMKSWGSDSSGVTWMLLRNNITHQTELWSYSIPSSQWTKRTVVPDPPDPPDATLALCGLDGGDSLAVVRGNGHTEYFLFNESKWQLADLENQRYKVNIVAWWCTEAHLWVLTDRNLLRKLDLASRNWSDVTLTPLEIPIRALTESHRWSKPNLSGGNLLYALSERNLWTLDTVSGAWTNIDTHLASKSIHFRLHSAACLDSNENLWLFNSKANVKTVVFHYKTNEWSTVDVPGNPVLNLMWCIRDQIFVLDTSSWNRCQHSNSTTVTCPYRVEVWSMGLSGMQASSVSAARLNNSQSLTLKTNCDKDFKKNKNGEKNRRNFDNGSLEESSTEGWKPQDEEHLRLNSTSNSTIFLGVNDTWVESLEPSSNSSNILVGKGPSMMDHGRSRNRSRIGIALSRPETYGSVIFFGLSLSVFAIFGIMLFFRRCVSCPPRNGVLLKETPPVRYTEITDESFAA